MSSFSAGKFTNCHTKIPSLFLFAFLHEKLDFKSLNTFVDILPYFRKSDPTEGILFQFGNLENIIKSNPSFTSKSPAPSSCSNSHSASDGDDALFVIGDRVGVADYFAMYTVASFIAVLGQTFQTVLAEVRIHSFDRSE